MANDGNICYVFASTIRVCCSRRTMDRCPLNKRKCTENLNSIYQLAYSEERTTRGTAEAYILPFICNARRHTAHSSITVILLPVLEMLGLDWQMAISVQIFSLEHAYGRFFHISLFVKLICSIAANLHIKWGNSDGVVCSSLIIHLGLW